MSFSINLLKLSFIFNGSIGRKSYLPIDRGHVPSRARVEKQKLMKSPSRKLFHSVIAIIGLACSELHRIRTAGTIAGDDNHGADAEAFEW